MHIYWRDGFPNNINTYNIYFIKTYYVISVQIQRIENEFLNGFRKIPHKKIQLIKNNKSISYV